MVRTAVPPALRLVLAASDDTFRRSIQASLENDFGYQVVGQAGSGTELVRLALAHEPDVIVFDLHLPHVSGLEGLRQIRQQQECAAVALAENRDQEGLYHIIADDVQFCLVKPFQPQQLHSAVVAAWARHQEVRQLRAECDSLRQTLQNRKIIERTKGVLMKRYRWSEAEAYRRLQRGAMNKRTPMVELAQAVLNGTEIEL